MKLLTAVLAMALAGSSVSFAQSNEVSVQSESLVQDHKKEIKAEELPEAVAKAIKESEYQEWVIDKVYLLENGQTALYELHLSFDNETKILMADAEGVLQPKADI